MADTVDEDHAQAALALLDADVGLTVFDGKVPDGTAPPYVQVYTSVARPPGQEGIANGLAGSSATYLVTWTCHCVGGTAAAARAVAMRVRAALLDQRPVINGRNCGPIRQIDAPPTQPPDETTGSAFFDATVIYRLVTG